MAEAATDPAEESGGKAKGGLKPIALGVVLALAGAGAGYFAATSGMLDSSATTEVEKEDEYHPAFVEIPPIIVSVAQPGGIAQLRMKLSLEVDEAKAEGVTAQMPRLLDVLNNYLRAVETVDLSDVTTLVRLRAQMLRRVQIVAGDDVVSDLLIQEFVVN